MNDEKNIELTEESLENALKDMGDYIPATNIIIPWNFVLCALKLDGIAKCILDNSSFIKYNDEYRSIEIEILSKYESLLTDNQLKKIRKGLSMYLGKEIDLTIKITDGDSIYRSVPDFKPLDIK